MTPQECAEDLSPDEDSDGDGDGDSGGKERSDDDHVAPNPPPPLPSPPPTPPTVELAVRVDAVKKRFPRLVVLDCLCVRGSRNRISAGDRCVVYVRASAASAFFFSFSPRVGVSGGGVGGGEIQSLCDSLAPGRGAAATAAAAAGGGRREAAGLGVQTVAEEYATNDAKPLLTFRTNARRAVGRNRKGVRTIDCEVIVSIAPGGHHLEEERSARTMDDGIEEEEEEEAVDTGDEESFLDKRERHGVFARWLVDTYGVEALSEGSGVLDVAGGQGQLSSALHGMGVPATLLDPKPRCAADGVPFKVIAEPLHGDGSELTDRHDNVRRCSLVAGMHPDQATEPAVDLALRLGVPFAVLPCCVMPSLFPNRRQSRDGDSVRSYSTFCSYLMEKAPKATPFREYHLPFAGRNKVIFMKTDACDAVLEG